LRITGTVRGRGDDGDVLHSFSLPEPLIYMPLSSYSGNDRRHKFLRVPPFPRHSDLSGQAQTLVP
jgi:hypothetical protein